MLAWALCPNNGLYDCTVTVEKPTGVAIVCEKAFRKWLGELIRIPLTHGMDNVGFVAGLKSSFCACYGKRVLGLADLV